MKKSEAIAHFGTQTQLAKALGITHSSVSQWGEEIPELRAFQIERLTEGQLSCEEKSSAPSTQPSIRGYDQCA